mmetsp:Transcript_56815/g.122856  ORF Transcript_56815/g.122856 Transcript_56815/m.122856 type:complete len:102 (-) Transcript_56815:805-1110(-)
MGLQLPNFGNLGNSRLVVAPNVKSNVSLSSSPRGLRVLDDSFCTAGDVDRDLAAERQAFAASVAIEAFVAGLFAGEFGSLLERTGVLDALAVRAEHTDRAL